MNPAGRDIPIIEATWDRATDKWSATLPDGRVITSKDSKVIDRAIRREAQAIPLWVAGAGRA